MAHDMAFRLLAEMRIDAFRKLDALAPAYLVRRRTGDLMALATHDIELVEYFFAHTVAPAFVAILVPAAVVVGAGLGQRLARAGAAAVPARRRPEPVPDAQARRPAGRRGARGGGRARRLRRRFGAGPGRDRGLPAGGARAATSSIELSQRHISLRLPFFRELTLQHAILEVLTGLGGLAVVVDGRGAGVAAARSIPACCRCSPCSPWRPSCRCRRSPRSAASSPTRWAPRGASMRWPTSRSRCATGRACRRARAPRRSRWRR